MKEVKFDSMFEAGVPVSSAQPFAVYEGGVPHEGSPLTTFKASNCMNTMHGLFPRRLDTVVAAVLVWLLDVGSPLTVWDGVQLFRTCHLEDAIRTLKKKYGWPIETITLPTRNDDGTIFCVTGYQLPDAAVSYAYANLDVRTWFSLVEAAQARKRARDRAKAAALDSYRILNNDPAYFVIHQYQYRR